MKKTKESKQKSIEEKEKLLLQNTIMSMVVAGALGLLYFTCFSAYKTMNRGADLFEQLSGGIDYLTHPSNLFPFQMKWIMDGMGWTMMIELFMLIFYFTDKMKVHHDVHTLKGSSEWANLRTIAQKYADFIDKHNYKDHINNILFSANVYVSLNISKHFHALNTLILGTTGSGKSRYVLKPNLLRMNTSYVITDPKGEILASCGEMLRRNGYRVRVVDILNMGQCDTYNPLIYCEKESDIKKITQAFIKNTDSSEGKSAGGKDPFWDDAMNAFLCATIALLTTKPKGSDVPYAQIPEVMGGMCYEPVFANICELTRMANKKWAKESGIELMQGVKLGDGKNNTANASELSAIFENLRFYEAKIQDCDVESIIKPYCLREWENFRIAPEKTSTTILMTTAVRLDPFNIEQVRHLTSTDTVDLTSFGTQRDALFLIIPPTDRTYNFLISFLYTQLFDILYKTGANGSIGSKILKLKNGELVKYFPKEDVDNGIEEAIQDIKNAKMIKQERHKPVTISIQKGKKTIQKKIEDSWYDIVDAKGHLITRRPNKKEADKYITNLQSAVLKNGKTPELPYHVRFLMDEFANIGELPEFKDKLATVRGYQISCTVICQSITQLKGMYPDDYEVVDANCPFTIFLGGDENTNNEYLSKKIGKSTIKGYNISLDNKQKANNSYNVEERELIKPEELGRLDYSKEIVLIYGEQPILDEKIDYPALKNYEQTHDFADDKNIPDFNVFQRPEATNQILNLIYRPIIATAIPNVFEFKEEAFLSIMNACTVSQAVETAIQNIERYPLNIASSEAAAF